MKLNHIKILFIKLCMLHDNAKIKVDYEPFTSWHSLKITTPLVPFITRMKFKIKFNKQFFVVFLTI